MAKTITKKASAKSQGRSAAKPAKNRPAKGTPPVASIAAAQKLLRSVDRREANLRAALNRQKTEIKQVAKSAAQHRARLKALKSDLDHVAKQRDAVAKTL